MLGGPEVHVPLPRRLHRVLRIITIRVSSMSPGPATAAAMYTASAAGRARETHSISVIYGRLTSELTGLSVQSFDDLSIIRVTWLIGTGAKLA